MLRIAWSLPVLAALGAALPGAASASAPPRKCHDTGRGYVHAHSIHETGMGCHIAREMVAHIIVHGPAELHSYRCTEHRIDHDTASWRCTGSVANVHQTLSFVVYATRTGAG